MHVALEAISASYIFWIESGLCLVQTIPIAMANPWTPLPPPPPTQFLSCKTFRPPPLDGSLTLCEMYEWHAKNTPNHRLFTFAKADGSMRAIYWPEAVRAIHRGARIVRDRIEPNPSCEEAPIVAILAAQGMFFFFE